MFFKVVGPRWTLETALAFSPTLVVITAAVHGSKNPRNYNVMLILAQLNYQTQRCELLDTRKLSAQINGWMYQYLSRVTLVPLKRSVANSLEYESDNALAVFCNPLEVRGGRQLFAAFTVRDARFVVICEPRFLAHIMHAPTAIDEGRSLLGFVDTDNYRRYELLLDVESGEQRPRTLDANGRPILLQHSAYLKVVEQTLEITACFLF